MQTHGYKRRTDTRLRVRRRELRVPQETASFEGHHQRQPLYVGKIIHNLTWSLSSTSPVFPNQYLGRKCQIGSNVSSQNLFKKGSHVSVKSDPLATSIKSEPSTMRPRYVGKASLKHLNLHYLRRIVSISRSSLCTCLSICSTCIFTSICSIGGWRASPLSFSRSNATPNSKIPAKTTVIQPLWLWWWWRLDAILLLMARWISYLNKCGLENIYEDDYQEQSSACFEPQIICH